jgi:hypothetical protein
MNCKDETEIEAKEDCKRDIACLPVCLPACLPACTRDTVCLSECSTGLNPSKETAMKKKRGGLLRQSLWWQPSIAAGETNLSYCICRQQAEHEYGLASALHYGLATPLLFSSSRGQGLGWQQAHGRHNNSQEDPQSRVKEGVFVVMHF